MYKHYYKLNYQGPRNAVLKLQLLRLCRNTLLLVSRLFEQRSAASGGAAVTLHAEQHPSDTVHIQENISCVYSECNKINESEDILKTYNYKVISINVFLNRTAMFLD